MASLEDKEEHHEDWNEENYHANGVYVGQELEDPRDGVRTPGDADGEGKADEEDDDYDLDVSSLAASASLLCCTHELYDICLRLLCATVPTSLYKSSCQCLLVLGSLSG